MRTELLSSGTDGRKVAVTTTPIPAREVKMSHDISISIATGSLYGADTKLSKEIPTELRTKERKTTAIEYGGDVFVCRKSRDIPFIEFKEKK